MMIVTIVATWLLSALSLQDAVGEARGLIAEAKFAEATRIASAALAEGTGDARELTLLLAEAQAAGGHAQKAIATLDTLGEVEDYDVALATGRAYIAWASELGAAGASDDDISVTLLDGKAHLKRAHAMAPEGRSEAMAELGGLMLYGLTDHRGVQTMVSPVLETDPENGEALYLRGAAGTFDFWAALQSGDEAAIDSTFAQVEADLLAADQNLPRSRSEVWSQLAWLYETAGRPGKAVDASIVVIERSPETSFDQLYRLAKRYSGEGDYAASGKALEKMVALSAREVTNRIRYEDFANDVATQLHWSIHPYVQRNDNATARSILSAIIAADPKNPVIWHNYAVMCEGTSRYEDALGAYERIMQLDERDPRPYNDAGTVLKFYLERDLEKANGYYDRCIEIADGQLAMAEDMDPGWKAHLMEARRLAQENIGGSEPSTGGGVRDLLGSFVDALGDINVPSDGEGEDGETEGGEDAGAGTDG